ncbi:MAG TPA: ABC transporter permease [Acidimicrobiales bacterium]|nr:ABC transporter permease [Acidimicrobiales bacterium]
MTALMVDTGTKPPPEREKRERFGAWRRLPPKAKVGALLLGFFILIAIIGPSLAPYDPSYQNPNPSLSLNSPSAAHLLGTTQNGQDVLSQLLTGVRMTLELAVIVGLVATAIAVVVGISAGFLGGLWDEVLSLLSNVFLVLPALPLLVVLLGYLPQKGETATILVLAFLGWPWGARIIRAQTLALRNRDFVAASRETGEASWHVIVYEIMPNEISLIAASFVGTVLYAIGASVALAFLGLADLNSWSLGTMLYWAQSDQALTLGAWWWFVPPGLVVALIGTALVLLNFGIDELGNPRLRSGSGTIKVGGKWWGQTDPTPVLSQAQRRPSRAGSFLHSFSRESLTEGPTEVAGPVP